MRIFRVFVDGVSYLVAVIPGGMGCSSVILCVLLLALPLGLLHILGFEVGNIFWFMTPTDDALIQPIGTYVEPLWNPDQIPGTRLTPKQAKFLYSVSNKLDWDGWREQQLREVLSRPETFLYGDPPHEIASGAIFVWEMGGDVKDFSLHERWVLFHHHDYWGRVFCVTPEGIGHCVRYPDIPCCGGLRGRTLDFRVDFQPSLKDPSGFQIQSCTKIAISGLDRVQSQPCVTVKVIEEGDYPIRSVLYPRASQR